MMTVEIFFDGNQLQAVFHNHCHQQKLCAPLSVIMTYYNHCHQSKPQTCLCFGCVCVSFRLKHKVLCVLQYMCTYVYVLYCVLFYWYLFYAVVRQISMLFIDNKDFVFCILIMTYLNHYRQYTVHTCLCDNDQHEQLPSINIPHLSL